MNNNTVLFAVSFAFVVGLSLTGVNAISPFTEIGNLEAEVLDAFNQVGDLINTLNATQMTQQVQIDLLNTIQISELAEQDGMQANITALQSDFDIVTIEVKSIMTSLNTVIRDHPVAFNDGLAGQNTSRTSVILHKAFVNTNVTNTFEYLESNRNFNNGTARSFQLADDVLLLGDSKIFLDTHIVPLGITFDTIIGLVDSCLILPTEDPNICSRTTSLIPGEELIVLFRHDDGGFITGLNNNIITTRITTVITP